MATAEIKRHWDRVADLGCIVCLAKPATIHHCHGGSLKEIGLHRAGGKKPIDWLVVPLCPTHHTGDFGIDGPMGVKRWEREYWPQVELLQWVSDRVGFDVIAKAREEMK